jgi:hypothetical protein
MKSHPLLDEATFDPAAFTPFAGVYLADDCGEDQADYLASALGELGGNDWLHAHTQREVCAELGATLIDSRFRQRGTCDHCGARFKFGMVYKHTSGALVVVGNTCADKSLSVSDRHTLLLNRARAAAKAAKDRAAHRASALAQAEAEGFSWLYSEPNHTNRILKDLAAKGMQYGNLTPRQVELLKRIFSGEPAQWEIEKAARDAARAAEDATKTPVIEGRIAVTGIVKAVKYVEGFSTYGPPIDVKKIIVRDDRGFTVWVTCPREIYDVDRGARVTFRATVTKGDRDECFGFGKRPSNAQVLPAVQS